uniref:Retrotransposon protein, putative, unclassified n=1 Tax=Oryza sativa subsp. japonica TaxID=39947 RepID=Q2R8H4_ORYSJ|nr:retrotransposon protein, putative, unclassified [Oryza sativa Japonica Group]
MEHISRFLAQCGEASTEEALKVRLFPLSLTRSAFTCISSLPSNSIKDWADLEKQFHSNFFAGIGELKLSDLVSIQQQEGESAMEYIKRFRNVRSRCYSLSLSDEQLADLAFQGLSTPIRDRFFCHEFDSLAHLMQTVSAHESRLEEAKEDQFSSHQDQKEDNFEA